MTLDYENLALLLEDVPRKIIRIPGEVTTLQHFTAVAKEARAIISDFNPEQDFYLTECTGCCSGGREPFSQTSYRVFAGRPSVWSPSAHADTGNDGFIVKIYGQPKGLCEEIAESILEGTGVVPEVSMTFRKEYSQNPGVWYKI